MLAIDDDFEWEAEFGSNVRRVKLLTFADAARSKQRRKKKASKRRGKKLRCNNRKRK